MGDKDTKFTFGRPEIADDRDPTVRDVHRLELEQSNDEPKPASGYNPYNRDVKKKAPEQAVNRTSTTTRTDLRKLSQWIKLKQDVEARKNSETGDTDRVPTVRMPKPKF